MGHAVQARPLGREGRATPWGQDRERQLSLQAGVGVHTLACSQNCSRLIRFISTAASVF